MAELNKKDVQNNKEEVPFAHYEARFRELDPEEAAQRCGVKFENGAFTVTLLGDEYVITWPEYTISADNPRAFARKNIPTPPEARRDKTKSYFFGVLLPSFYKWTFEISADRSAKCAPRANSSERESLTLGIQSIFIGCASEKTILFCRFLFFSLPLPRIVGVGFQGRGMCRR